MERDALWMMVVDAKYGSMWGSWCSNSVQGPYEFCLWKSIRKGWDGYVSFRDESVADLLSLLGDSYHYKIGSWNQLHLFYIYLFWFNEK